MKRGVKGDVVLSTLVKQGFVQKEILTWHICYEKTGVGEIATKSNQKY